jgi:prepilin signal peptidase PulO-like enzyme (type II secretory pathway)
MIALLSGWCIGWLIHILSDVIPYRMHSPGAVQPNWLPLGGMYRQSPPAYARLHLLAEVLSAGSLFWISTHYPIEQHLVLTVIYAFLLLVTLIDLKYQRILNITVYPALLVVALAALLSIDSTIGLHLAGGLMAFGSFWAAARTTRGGLGGGDIKLAGLLGMAFGLPGIMWVLLVGTGLGALMAVLMLVSRNGQRTTRIPYAPFLCVGAWAVLLVLVH